MRKIVYVAPFVNSSMAEVIMVRLLQESQPVKWTLLCFEGSSITALHTFCKKHQIDFELIKLDSSGTGLTLQNQCFLLSWRVYQILRNRDVNEIRFLDHYGSGFHCIQSRRTGIAFKHTQLCVDMLGSSQYLNEIEEHWGVGGFDQMLVQHMERYCCQYCDELFFPTVAMRDWALQKRWILCSRQQLYPFKEISVMEQHASPLPSRLLSSEMSGTTLIFYGPLTRAAGLPLFVNALRRLDNAGRSQQIARVLFVGEWHTIDSKRCNEYLRENLSGCRFQWEITGYLTASQLLEVTHGTKGTVFFCSTQRVNPPTLRTMAGCGLPIVAVDTPAHQELFLKGTLCPVSPAQLSAAILNGPYAQASSDVSPTLVRYSSQHKHSVRTGRPLVSICTAFYNHGRYLESARKSIENQTYENIEWIIVDDGSTDTDSVRILEKYRTEYKDRPYQILRKQNEGPSIARNYAAEHAKGEYLLFMDSDNVAMPHMVSTFIKGIMTSGCDCLSSYFDQFEGEGLVNNQSLTGVTYALVGACLEMGAFMNCFGDTNFIIRREVFQTLGGFLPQRIVTEDWQILARMVLKGYNIDVIPEPLFWYRVLPQSNLSYGSEYYKQQLILETYCRDLPPYMYHIFNSLCRPSLEPRPELSSGYSKLIELGNRILPIHSRRRAFIKKIAKLVLH